MKMIETGKLDELLAEYIKSRKQDRNIKFSEYVEALLDETGEPIAELVDSVGIVKKADFEGAFQKPFIDEHFENLAEAWFKGLNSQVDFGIVLDCVKDMFHATSQNKLPCSECGDQIV